MACPARTNAQNVYGGFLNENLKKKLFYPS
jgi:hypothetical protein